MKITVSLVRLNNVKEQKHWINYFTVHCKGIHKGTGILYIFFKYSIYKLNIGSVFIYTQQYNKVLKVERRKEI
jgi:hypothetical protein